jgi:S-adenosylhomocysteine hydrolase
MTKILAAPAIRALVDNLALVRDREARFEGLLELAQGIPGSEKNMQLFADALVDNAALDRIAALYGASPPPPDVRRDRPIVRSGPFAAFSLRDAPVPKSDRIVSERASALADRAPPFSVPQGAAAVQQANGIPVGSFLRLDDVMDLLLTKAGEPIVQGTARYLTEHGGDPNVQLDPMPQKLADPLAQRLLAYFVVMRFEGNLRLRLGPAEVSALMPSALVSALSDVSDDYGRVSVGAMLQHFGPEAVGLLKRLSADLEHGKKHVPSSRGRAKYRYLPKGIDELLPKSVAPSDIDGRMSGFWQIVNELATPETLRGFRLVERGHMTESTEVLLRAFLAAGAEPGPLLGKSYSANADVLYRAHELGWKVHERSLRNPELDLDQAIYPLAPFLFDAAANARNLLIVDDGFEVSSALYGLKQGGQALSPTLERIVAVEQTEKGKHRFKELEAEGFELDYPVFDMAGSWLKKKFESPAIGEAVAFQIEHDLWEANPDLKIEPREAAIIGFGAVGSATAERLRARGYKVFVYDIDPAKMAAAAQAGYDVGGFPVDQQPEGKGLEAALDRARDRVFAHGHLTVGCTPSTCLERREYGKLPDHAVLANAGSGYDAFGEPEAAGNPRSSEAGVNEGFGQRQAMDRDGQNIDGDLRLALPGLVDYRDIPGAGDILRDDRESVDGRGMRHNRFNGLDLTTGDAAARDRNYHRVARDDDGAERLVLRNGGVVNLRFDLPPEYAQITRALLFASSVLAVKHAGAKRGWNDLPDDLQRRMLEIVEADLARKGLSVTVPDFMKTPPVGAEAFVEAMRARARG